MSSAIVVIDLGDFSRPEVQATAARFAQRKLGGQPLINRMARRLSECTLVDGVYIVGSNIPSSLLTMGAANVRTLNFPSCHVCERLAAVADTANAEWVVFVPANRPFVDSELIDQLLAKAIKAGDQCDYVGYSSDDGGWQKVDRLGLTGEVCHADTLRRLRRNADRLPSGEAQCLASWLQNSPGAFHLKFVPVPRELDRSDLRFSVSDESDWDDAELLWDTVRHDDSQWQQLTRLVIGNSRLRESMEVRNG